MDTPCPHIASSLQQTNYRQRGTGGNRRNSSNQRVSEVSQGNTKQSGQEAGSRSGDSASSFLHHLPLNLERMFASSLFILFISASLLLPADRSALLSMHRAAITHEYNILPFLKDPPPLRNVASGFNRTLQHKSFLKAVTYLYFIMSRSRNLRPPVLTRRPDDAAGSHRANPPCFLLLSRSVVTKTSKSNITLCSVSPETSG